MICRVIISFWKKKRQKAFICIKVYFPLRRWSGNKTRRACSSSPTSSVCLTLAFFLPAALVVFLRNTWIWHVSWVKWTSSLSHCGSGTWTPHSSEVCQTFSVSKPVYVRSRSLGPKGGMQVSPEPRGRTDTEVLRIIKFLKEPIKVNSIKNTFSSSTRYNTKLLL